MIVLIILAVLGFCMLLMGIVAVLHQRQINLLAARLDDLNKVLVPILSREAELQLSELSSGLGGLAEMMEEAGAGDPKVQEVLAPHIENLRGTAHKLKGEEKPK